MKLVLLTFDREATTSSDLPLRVCYGDFQHELLQGPGVSLGHTLTGRGDVSFGVEQTSQPDSHVLQHREAHTQGSYSGER